MQSLNQSQPEPRRRAIEFNFANHVTTSGNGAAPRILVVGCGDAESHRLLSAYFADENMHVAYATGPKGMSRYFVTLEPSLVLLDVHNCSGFDLLRMIRARSTVPVIITSGHCHDEVDRVMGLEMGADDYVIMPCGQRELLARVRAVLRRHRLGAIAGRRSDASGGYSFAGWYLDLDTRRLLDPEGTDVYLTKSEYSLLVTFLLAPGRPLTRGFLTQATRVDEDVFDRSIDVKVLRLRRKLQATPDAPQAIVTERGIGYCFCLPIEHHLTRGLWSTLPTQER